MRKISRGKSDIFFAQEFTVDEWFYLCRWRESRMRIWAVIDMTSKEIIIDSITRDQAVDMSLEKNLEGNKTIVVNSKDSLYNSFRSKNGVCDEDPDFRRNKDC